MMKFIFLMILSCFGIVFTGYVLTCLWQWFLIPAFAVPALSLKTACGMSIIVSLLASQFIRNYAEDEKDELEVAVAGYIYMFLLPAACWVFGWLIYKIL